MAGCSAAVTAQTEGIGLRPKTPSTIGGGGPGVQLPGYGGAVASLQDTWIRESESRVQFFYVRAMAGKEIPNGFSASRERNAGRGLGLGTAMFSREIGPDRVIVSLVGEVSYGAPIEAMLNSATMYKVSRRVAFTPEVGKAYLVKGELNRERQDVWLEDDNGERVGTFLDSAEKDRP